MYSVGNSSLISTISIEAVQVGGVGSSYGAIGTWTTITHDEDDPIGWYPLLVLSLFH